MGNLLGKDKSKAHKLKADQLPPKDKAVYDLKLQRDKLKQYQKKIETVLQKEVEVAKHHLRVGDQGRALLALKKKKYQEHLLRQTDQQLLNLEQLTSQIEYSLVEQDVIKGLQQGNQILEQIHKEMSLDAVQKLMDDTADAIAYQAEIDAMISGVISPEDEEEIMAQLDALEAEEAQEAAAKLPAVPEQPLEVGETAGVKTPAVARQNTIDLDALPAVPTTALPEVREEAEAQSRRKGKEKATLEEPVPA